MTQIIPIGKSDFAGCPKQTVNARELHAFLENRDHSEAIRGVHNRFD